MYVCMMYVCMYVCIYIGAEEGGLERSKARDAHGLRQEPHATLQGLQRPAPRSGSKVSSKVSKAIKECAQTRSTFSVRMCFSPAVKLAGNFKL